MKEQSKAAYLTTAEVAEACQVTGTTIVRWCDAGKGPPHHKTPGGRRRFNKAALPGWMRERGMVVPAGLTEPG